MRIKEHIQKSFRCIFKHIQAAMFLYVTLIVTPCWKSQMLVYLHLMEMWGREDGGEVFLWFVSNIRVSVTGSCVMTKRRIGVFVSVFCDARESIELQHYRQCHRDNAVSLYFLEKPHFTLAKEPKVIKNNV